MQDARDHVHALAPELAVGLTVTHRALSDSPTLFATLRDAGDVTAFTYYPILPDFSVEPPSVVAVDFAAMSLAVAPGPLLLQEVGYPAGYLDGSPSALQSSAEQQRQFTANVFTELGLNPNLRALSFQHQFDWPAALLDEFEGYYGSSAPAFREFLGTIGLMDDEALPKPAWGEYLAGLAGL